MNDGTQDLWAISDGQFKIIANPGGTVEMYDLSVDPYEGSNLLDGILNAEQTEAKAALESELANIRN